jgi:uncharacterized protein (DUF1499 family)
MAFHARSSALGLPFFLLAACGGSPPPTLGPANGTLPPCPGTPNCIHTGDRHPEGTAPMILTPDWADADPAELLGQVAEALETLPRTTVVHRAERYLHAEATSLVFRFVDDVEVYLPPTGGELVVRSASRVGRSDLGVNERRVESLRARLQDRGVVTASGTGESSGR